LGVVALVIETVARFIQSSAANADAAATVITATPTRARKKRFTPPCYWAVWVYVL